jgi:hypothetical protein
MISRIMKRFSMNLKIYFNNKIIIMVGGMTAKFLSSIEINIY